MKQPRSFRLAPDVIARLAEEPSPSAYLEALVRVDMHGGMLWRCASCDAVASEQPRYCQRCGTIPTGGSE